MIFGNIEHEEVVQLGDRTRINAESSFISPDEAAVTKVEIQPAASESFYDVTNSDQEKWYLDWVYSVAGSVVMTVRITTDGAAVLKTSTITTITETDDRLFSNDSDIKTYEGNILDYVTKGRSSHLDKHRAAQNDIMKKIQEMGLTNTDGTALTKEHIYDVDDVMNWSKYLALAYIFESSSNAIDDVFAEKAKKYRGEAKNAQNMSRLRFDLDKDGTQDAVANLRSFDMCRQ